MVSALVGLSDLLVSLSGGGGGSSFIRLSGRAGGDASRRAAKEKGREKGRWLFLLIGHIFRQLFLADERVR